MDIAFLSEKKFQMDKIPYSATWCWRSDSYFTWRTADSVKQQNQNSNQTCTRQPLTASVGCLHQPGNVPAKMLI